MDAHDRFGFVGRPANARAVATLPTFSPIRRVAAEQRRVYNFINIVLDPRARRPRTYGVLVLEARAGFVLRESPNKTIFE